MGAEHGSGAQLANPSASPHEGPGQGPTCIATRAGQSRLTSARIDVSRARTETAVLGGSRRGHCEAVNVAPGTAFPSRAIEYDSPARKTEQPVPDTEYQNKKHRNEYYIADRREQER